MKVWIKLLIGSILGISLGLLLPEASPFVDSALIWLESMALRLGQYILAPLLFFSFAISIFKLRKDDRMWPLVLKSLAVILVSSLVLVGFGILVINIFPPGRIPILKEGQTELIALDSAQFILDIFPENSFLALIGGPGFIVPIVVFAFFLGAGLSYEKNHAKTITTLIDSLARVFYYVSSFFSEVLGIFLLALSAAWAVKFRAALRLEIFKDILILFSIVTGVTVLGLLPACLYVLGKKANPWKQLYGTTGPALCALFSANYFFCMPVMFRHAKENHGVKRRANTITITLFSIFARGGSAMIAIMSLFVVLRSYSSLALELGDVLSLIFVTIGYSFLLARFPGNGAYIALALLCTWYGHDFEAGYLILKPIAFYLAAMGTLIDVVLGSLGTWLIARLEGYQNEVGAIHFI
jgi:aerobic C4-dicarboxylate transport protein